MKIKIQNLNELSDALSRLTPEQRDQKIKIIMEGSSSASTMMLEVTEEPFMEHQDDPSQCGYQSELKANLRDWEVAKFKEVEPIGTVILFAK